MLEWPVSMYCQQWKPLKPVGVRGDWRPEMTRRRVGSRPFPVASENSIRRTMYSLIGQRVLGCARTFRSCSSLVIKPTKRTLAFFDAHLLRGLMVREGLACASAFHCLRLRAISLLFVLGAWFGLMASAHAGTTVRVVETWPSGNSVVLGRNQNFYLRLAYDTDKPIHIWVKPFFNGKEVNAGSNPSLTYSGSGETFGWFFFMQPGDAADEVRVTAGDGSAANTPVVATWRGHVAAGSGDAGAQAPPAWVAEMSARVKAAQEQAYRQRMSEPVSAGETVLYTGFMLTMLALGLLGFALPAWGMRRWHGGWRMAAAVPTAMMAFVTLRIVFGVMRDPASHNLWPFEILMAGAGSAAVMAVLTVARKLSGVGR
jgi:hypothetical protein